MPHEVRGYDLRMRFVAWFLVVVVLVAGGAWIVAGRMAGPAIEIRQPSKVMGAKGTLDVSIDAPRGELATLEVALEQQGTRTVLASLTGGEATLSQAGPDRIRIQRAIDRSSVKGLKPGPARIVVSASRPVLYGTRTVASSAVRDVTVRLDPPRVSVVSMHHHVNHGGSEMVVYRVAPADVQSGVRVGDVEYPGYPASGAGILVDKSIADAGLRVAFFALLYDQDLKTPIHVFARDEAGNAARADFDYRVFPKPFRRSRIELDDGFLGRVVPAILERTPDLKAEGDDLARFLVINGDLRRQNAETRSQRSRRGPSGKRCGGDRSSSSAIRRSRLRSRISAPTSTRGAKSIARFISDSTWLRRPTYRSSPQTAARSCTPTTSGFTVTA